MAEHKKVLIIEDDPSVVQVLGEQCQKKGYKVLTAPDGEIGLQTAIKETPDLIVLDIMMPKMDGSQVLAQLRHNKKERNVPVIFLTNITPDDGIMKGIMENEPSYYLVKSDSPMQEIMTKIDILLHKQAAVNS